MKMNAFCFLAAICLFCSEFHSTKCNSNNDFFEPWSEHSFDSLSNDVGEIDSLNSNIPADQPPKVFNIGAVLSREEQLQDFLQVIDNMYYEPNVLPAGLTLYPHSLPLQINPIKTVQGVCDKLIKNQVYVVLVSDSTSAESLAVTQTCGLYQIPVIGLSNRDSAMSDKHMHPVYMRTVPPFSHQVDVWIRILQSFEYRHVVFIHTDDYEGRSSVTRFQQLADEAHIELSHVIEYRAGSGRLADQLAMADRLQARIYLLYAPETQAQSILLEAQKLHLTESGYVWLVAEQALNAPNIPDGAIGARLFAGRNSSAHIRDALFVVGLALREWINVRTQTNAGMFNAPPSLEAMLSQQNQSKFGNQNERHQYFAPPPGYCGDHRKSAWSAGQRFYHVLRKQSLLYGRSGRVAFDGKGDRISADYDIVNVIRGKLTTVGSFSYNQAKRKMQLWLNEQSIVWPGGLTERPAGYVLPEQLQVVTLQEKPFVWSRPVAEWKVRNLRLHVRRVNHEVLLSVGLRKNQSRVISTHEPNNDNLNRNPSLSQNTRTKNRGSNRSKSKGHSTTSTTPSPDSYTTDHGMLPGYDFQGRIRSKGSGQHVNRKASSSRTSSGSVTPVPVEEDETLDLPEEMLPGMLRFDPSFLQKELCERNELLCPKMNESNQIEYFCCKGYCIDLLVELTGRLNISFVLHQAKDGQYGSFEPDANQGGRRRWTGLVGELVEQQADMIVAPLTINPERSLYIDFSKPFKYQGITIIERQQTASRASLASFMEPFEDSLWILVMVSVHVVALALYLLDRFSPFGRYRLPNCDVTEEDALNLSSAIWFAWGVLLNSGIGEGTPRSFSGRVLGMVWAGFAMIIVASYTGNLAAFLVLNRPENTLTGINDSRLRNPTDNYTYSTVKNSAVEMYFKRQMELTNIYMHLIKNKPHYTVEEGIEAVKNSEINAFIWDSARLEYEASQDCGLVIAAEQFGRSGYGIGLAKNSFWTEKVNQAILSMHESGFMEKLDNEWILNVNPECINRNNVKFPTTLGLRNMAGVFILVGIGIVGGIGLIVIEVIYKKQQNRKQRQLENARYAAEKWKKFVARQRSYRTNAHQLRTIRMKHKMEQQHSQPSQESQQPLLAASPAATSLSGQHNPHLSLSKCNSGAIDTIEEMQPHTSNNHLLPSTTSHDSNVYQQQLRNRKNQIHKVIKPSTPIQFHQDQTVPTSLFEATADIHNQYSAFSLHSLPPPPAEFDWNSSQVQQSHGEQDQSSLGLAMHSLHPHVLSRSAALLSDSLNKKKTTMKKQRKPTQHHSPSDFYCNEPVSVSFEANVNESTRYPPPSYPPKPNRRSRAQPQLQHQEAIASNESLLQPYFSPTHLSTSANAYNSMHLNANRSAGDLYADSIGQASGSGYLRSALKPPHSSNYTSVRQSNHTSTSNIQFRQQQQQSQSSLS